MEKLLDLILVDELPAFVRGKKLVEVKGVIYRSLFVRKVQPPLDPLPDHAGELVGEHRQTGQRLVGVAVLTAPVFFGLLLVSIGPVENLLFGESLTGQGFEGCAGEIQRVFASNVTESAVSFISVHTLLSLVYDQEVKLHARLLFAILIPIFFCHPLQLVILAAEIDRPLQALQGFKGDHLVGSVWVPQTAGDKFLPRQDAGPAPQSICVGHKGILAPPADKFEKIVRPGVGDAGAVGDDQHLGKAHLPDKVIGGQRLSESGLSVPEKLPAAALEVHLRHGHSLPLLFAEGISKFLRI